MTLEQLLSQLNDLYTSALSAPVEVRAGDTEDYDVVSVRYESSVVIVECEPIEGDGDD